MDEKKLKQIEQELLKGLDKEQEAEEYVMNLSAEIAAKLMLNNKTTAEVDGLEYSFAYQVVSIGKKKGINMVVANLNKFKLLQEKYRPYIVNAEIDNDFSLQENLQSIVEAYLRHILDMVKAEEL